MVSLVFLYNKKYNKTYVYESINYWDKSEKKSKSKRKLIGIKDPLTGQIVPTSTQKKKLEENKAQNDKRKFYGANLLLNLIAKKLGLTSNLKECFPDLYKEILSVAQYLILEKDSPISRYEKWSKIYKTFNRSELTSQRISEMFSEINESGKNNFFKLQAEQLKEDEYWAYDTTSISSYSKAINQMRYGYNKENDTLAQINLAILYGEKSRLPFYYRVLPGNIVDVSTVRRLIKDVQYIGVKKPKLMMDRGFYSKNNIDELMNNKFKFIVGTKSSSKIIKERIEKVKDIKKFTNYIAEYNIYGKKEILMWDDTDKENKKYLYLYVFFDDEKALKEDKDFTEYLIKLKTDIENNVENEKRVEDYRKYFDIKVEKGNIIAVAKDDIIEKHMKKYGYFSLISNENLEAREILSIYRQKDVAEKAFHNIKDRLDARRLRVSSKPTMDGKIFVTFVSLVILSYIKNKMSEKELYKKYTTQELLDELDLIESYERGNEKLKLAEVTKKQKEIFKYMDIKFPEELL